MITTHKIFSPRPPPGHLCTATVPSLHCWLRVLHCLLLTVLLGLATTGFAHAEQGHAHDNHDGEAVGADAGNEYEDHGSDAVTVGADVREEFGITLEVASSARITRTVTLPAEVRPNEDRLAHITPRFAGIVKEVKKKVGDRAEPGEILALIESSGSLAPYPLKTEIAGVVIAKHITRGEPVTRESEAFVIADLDDVWIDISAYQKDFTELQIGQKVVVSAGHGRDQAEGQISYISPIVDEETRTATARVVLANPNRVWRPGMFVTARVLVEDATVPVAVPRTAIETVEGRAVVFVETEVGFEPRPIETDRRDDLRVEIVSGLRPGDRFVATGGFTLKAELAREELSGGHSH